MRNALIFVFVLNFSGLLSAADIKIPDGYREATPKDYVHEEGNFPKGNPPIKVTADFNGDGKQDIAVILIKSDGNGWALFVLLANQKTMLKLDEVTEKAPPHMGIDLVKPGTIKTACAKGYWECKPDEPLELKLTLPAINYFMFESANSLFFWDKKSGAFKRVWISD
ncbi:MAG TPA: FG-GAP repeat protein [bacterium]|nr:FG-GAP repeat protein [bacterium]